MDNPEYTFQILEVFAKIKTKEIPRELEEYISYVARTGDPVFQWSLVKILIKEKLLAVLNEFKENNPSLEIPPCPNVDSFNYEAMKNNLLSRLDSFILPPFTIQRICELLSAPRKEYSRIDKFMRAVEKNVLVVSACELSLKRGLEPENNDSMMNGMLYDKVNDSLNSFTNHVFSTTHESNVDELNLSGKVDVPENDTVQQILDETWTESGNGEVFKVSETNTSSLSVNFDNELHFASEKNSNNDKDEISDETESKNTVDNTSFNENDTLLVEPSLQNMIVENTDIHYDDEALKPTTSAESTSSEVNVACDKPEDNAVFNFNDNNSQMGNDISGQGEVLVTPESEKVSQLVKKSFDISSNEASGSKCQENNTEDDSKPCSSDHSFSENITNNESLESGNHLQNEQCKTEHSFEYDDFSQTSSKSDNSNEYNFIPDSSKNQDEDVTLEYSDNLSNVVDTKDDNDEIQKVTFPLSSLADDNLILTEATNATSHRVTDEVHLSPDKSNSNDDDNESLSCGDKESSSCSNTAECPKEPDLVPQVYGEPDPNNTGHE